MKRLVLMAAAAAAATMSATPAVANSGGYLGANYSSGEVDQNVGADPDIDSWQAEGEFGWNTGSWGGQVGGGFGNADISTLGDTDFARANGHLYWGNETWRLGGFITYGTIDEANLDEWNYGAEGSFNFGPNTTVFAYGSLGTLDNNGTEFDTWNVDFALGHYFTDNFRLAGNVGWGTVEEFFPGADADTQSYGVNAEWQAFSHVSFTGGYNVFNAEAGPIEADSNYFSVGARWNFGAATLRERNSLTPFTGSTGYAARIYGVGTY